VIKEKFTATRESAKTRKVAAKASHAEQEEMYKSAGSSARRIDYTEDRLMKAEGQGRAQG
jgi:predicted ribosome-associated RNA-binding protein Tma20